MNKIGPWKSTLVVVLLLLIPAACSAIDPGQFLPGSRRDPATVAAPEPTMAVADSSAPISLPTTADTPGIMCTPPACAPGETYSCPSGDCPGGCGTICAAATPVSDSLPPAPTDWESLEDWLASAWRANANPAAVRDALQRAGWQKSMDDWRAADFDGDLQDEWALILYDRSMPPATFGLAGDLWVVNGSGTIFRYYIAPSSDIFNFIAPKIVTLTDMTGDGRPELVANATTCGANTCFDNYRVLGWVDGRLADLQSVPSSADDSIGASPITMSYSDTRFADANADGLPDLLVHGGTLGSAGSGVVRPRTEIWSWDGSAVTLAKTVLDPTDYRHLILYEANDLMAAGDLDGALTLYEATINDPALRNDGFFLHEPEQVYADISAFAAFRLILIDLMQDNIERAASRLAWLQATYPNSAAAGAATTLVGNWSGSANAGVLCADIEAELSTQDAPAGALADMGYGNPSLGAADFCPAMNGG